MLPEIEVGEGDGDEDHPAVATSRARARARPRCAPSLASDAYAAEAPVPAGFGVLFAEPAAAELTAAAGATEPRLLGEACLETPLLGSWPPLAPPPAAAVFLGDTFVAAPVLPEAARSASLADFIASRSAALRASTRAAARSTAAFGVRFLESTTPFPVPAPAPAAEAAVLRGGAAEVRRPATADEERRSAFLLPPARVLPPSAAPLGFADEVDAAAAAFFRPPFPAKPPLIQPFSRLKESFTWYLPLRGDEAAAAPPPPRGAATDRRAETLLPRARKTSRPEAAAAAARGELPSSAVGLVFPTPDNVRAASASSSVGSITPASAESGRAMPAETDRRWCPPRARTGGEAVSPATSGTPERGGAPSARSCMIARQATNGAGR